MKESYLKFVNQELESLNIKDLENILYLFFSNKLNIESSLFYSRYENCLKIFIKNHSLVKEEEKKVGYYLFCLFGEEKLNQYLSHFSEKYQFHLSYSEEERKFLPLHYRKLEIFYHYQCLRNQYRSIDKEKWKEAFDILFKVDNFLERYQSLQRKKDFIKKEQIDEQTFKDYVFLYAFDTPIKEEIVELYASKKISYQSLGLNTHAFPFYQIKTKEDIIHLILNTNDLESLKKIIYDLGISSATIYLIYKHYPDIRKKYASHKKELLEKVTQVQLVLEKEYKYISTSKVLSLIEKSEDEEFIYQILKNNRNRNYEVYKFIRLYRPLKNREEREKLEKEIKGKFMRAMERIRQDEKKEKDIQLEEANERIMDALSHFLENDYLSIKEFAKENGFSYSKTLKCFQKLKQTNEKLYYQIKEKLNSLKEKEFKGLLVQVYQICQEIVYGVERENGTKGEFDILDYYLKTNLNYYDFNKLYPQCGSFTLDEKMKIKKFLAKIKENQPVYIQTELQSKMIVVIDGQTHEITEDEKIFAFEYLKQHHLPLYYSVYYTALRRIVKENQEKVKVKKK